MLISVVQYREEISRMLRRRLLSTLKLVLNKVTAIVIVLCSTVYTFLLSSAVDPLNCVRSDDGSSTPVFFMAFNPSNLCFDQQWYNNLPVVVFFCTIYGIALPSAVGYILHKNKYRLDDSEFVSKYGTLFRPFTRVCLFWELVLMVKKASFILVIRLLSNRKGTSYGTKFTASITNIGFFLALEAIVQPYVRKSTNFRSST
jgi:hypothetical protein